MTATMSEAMHRLIRRRIVTKDVAFTARRGEHSKVCGCSSHCAVHLLLGHSKIESTVRYLGVEIDDAIEIAEKIDV